MCRGYRNWDFPNGGQPRYQPAAAGAPPPLSTEYERPPPYYYPGPGQVLSITFGGVMVV